MDTISLDSLTTIKKKKRDYRKVSLIISGFNRQADEGSTQGNTLFLYFSYNHYLE